MFPERRYLFKKNRITEEGLADISNFGIKYSDLYNNPIVKKSLTDHFQPKTAWENWIFLTYDCNLDCNYCFEDKKKVKLKWDVNELVNFFRWQTEKRDRKYFQENSKIVFYGGEPLLEQKLMEDILKKAEGLPFDFGLQTNGTLLDKVGTYILDKVSMISVSIDGSKESHDRNRHFKSGKGSYNIIINTLSEVRKRYNGRVLARMTIPITPEYDFFREVKSIIDTGLFTDYYWQLETPIHRELTENDIQIFLKNYMSGIKDIVDFWLNKIKRKKTINIIPFETAVKKIIFDELVVDLKANDQYTIMKEARGPCGCGDKLVVINLDGKCYPCDTLVGREDAIIGDIWTGVDPRRFIENNEFFVYGAFKGCPRRTIKSNAQITYTKETKGCPAISGDEPDFYCQSAGGFVGRIRYHMKDILNSDRTDFFSPISDFTEQLP